jgi:multidrug efflux system membrane fusion protein
MTRKILLPILILIIGAGGAAILFASKDVVETRQPEILPPLVRVSTVQPQKVQMIVATQGTVAPRTESTLIAQVAGQIRTVSSAFASGGFFEKGDLLLTIDPRDYEVAVSQAKVQVAQAELRISREQEEADIAYQEWGKIGKGQPSALVLRKPQIAEAEATLEAALGSLIRAKLNLERTYIRAPYAGRVRSKNADVGQYMGPGSPIGRIYAVDYAEVRLPIANQDLAFLDLDFGFRGQTETTKGPTVKLHADFGGQTHTWEGQIVLVEGEVDARSRMVYLVARIDNPYGRSKDGNRPPLAVGMYVTAEVLGKMADDVYTIPRAALRANRDILVVTDNRLYFREIDILRADAEKVIVKSGLNPGDQLCLSPLDTAVDGMRVRPHKVDRSGNTQGGVQ